MNIENKIKEQRLAEAINKDLFGAQGKLSVICQMFGNPIIEDVFGGDQTELSFYDTDEEDNIKTFSEEHQTFLLGYFYDGVNLGNKIEIKYLIQESEIKLYHKGYVKYHEIANELLAYTPEKEWENYIDTIFVKSKEKLKNINEEKLKIQDLKTDKIKKDLIDKIRSKWGNDWI